MNQTLPFTTYKLPGTGGVIKCSHDDFIVEELPSYTASGEGEHLMLLIQKKGLTTLEIEKRLKRAFHVGNRDIGYAGLKDKHAVTLQRMTVHLPTQSDAHIRDGLQTLQGDDRVVVVDAKRHNNKLRRGHHKGNRFTLRIRETEPMVGLVRADAIMAELESKGAPNYFGHQRFGAAGATHLPGIGLLKNDAELYLQLALLKPRDVDNDAAAQARTLARQGAYEEALGLMPKALHSERFLLDMLKQGKDATQAAKAQPTALKRLYAHALQSALFNDILAQRIANSTWRTLQEGDVAAINKGAVFAVDAETIAIENAPNGRIASGEIHPTGPLFGGKMVRPTGEIDALESKVLETYQLERDWFNAQSPLLSQSLHGERRPLRIMPKHTQCSAGADEKGPYIQVAFELPRGAYATNILREIIKPNTQDKWDVSIAHPPNVTFVSDPE